MSEQKKLYRSTKDKMIGGVCGGIASYFGTDPTLIRVGFVIFALMGAGLLAYPIMYLIMPPMPDESAVVPNPETSG